MDHKYVRPNNLTCPKGASLFEDFQHILEKRTISSVKYFIRTVLGSGPTSTHTKKRYFHVQSVEQR
jgi:hypothetical protein